MEQGSLRVDANISIRRPGDGQLGTKAEVKNLNSFANVERALEAERTRQVALLESGGRVAQVTLLFNAGTGQVKQLRSKEESHDYRYFPDPDLPPLVLNDAWIAERRESLPELPEARRSRLEMALGIPAYDARVLTSEVPLADYFESVVAAGVEPKTAANWVMGDVIATFNETGAFPVTAARLASLVGLVRAGTLSHQAAKRVYAEMAQAPDGEPAAVAERLGLVQVSDQGALGTWVDEVLAAHPAEVARFQGRRDQADGVLRRASHEEEQGQGRSEGRAAGAPREAPVDAARRRAPRSSGRLVHGGSAVPPSRTRVIGSIEAAPYRMIQCRCGPVTRPVRPTDPILVPAATVSPCATVHLTQMEVPGHQTGSVVQVHGPPSQVEVGHQRDHATRRGRHRRADCAGEVGAGVSARHLPVVFARAAVGTRDPAVPRQPERQRPEPRRRMRAARDLARLGQLRFDPKSRRAVVGDHPRCDSEISPADRPAAAPAGSASVNRSGPAVTA